MLAHLPIGCNPALTPTIRAADYMALPASQYSVLDAETVERLDDNTFVCHVAGLTFFSFEVHPVLTVSVSVGPTGPTVDLLKTEVGAVWRHRGRLTQDTPSSHTAHLGWDCAMLHRESSHASLQPHCSFVGLARCGPPTRGSLLG